MWMEMSPPRVLALLIMLFLPEPRLLPRLPAAGILIISKGEVNCERRLRRRRY